MFIKVNLNDDLEYEFRKKSKASKVEMHTIAEDILQLWLDTKDTEAFKQSTPKPKVDKPVEKPKEVKTLEVPFKDIDLNCMTLAELNSCIQEWQKTYSKDAILMREGNIWSIEHDKP